MTRAARAALEAAAQVVLSEAQWRHVDDVLAAFVPDFGREQSEAERGELIKAVVQALTIFHGRAAGMVQAWQGAHRHELERRRAQEKYRGLLRTVVRAWREERSAVPGEHSLTIMITLAIAAAFFYFTNQNYVIFNGFSGFNGVLPPRLFGAAVFFSPQSA